MKEDNEADDDSEDFSEEEEWWSVGGLLIPAMPDWYEIEIPKEEEECRMLLEKEDGLGTVQFSLPPERKGRVVPGELRHNLLEIAKGTEMGRGFDYVELKGKNLVLGCSFRPDDEFHRLWFWSDRKRLVLVSYSCTADPDADELKEVAGMVARLRWSDPA